MYKRIARTCQFFSFCPRRQSAKAPVHTQPSPLCRNRQSVSRIVTYNRLVQYKNSEKTAQKRMILIARTYLFSFRRRSCLVQNANRKHQIVHHLRDKANTNDGDGIVGTVLRSIDCFLGVDRQTERRTNECESRVRRVVDFEGMIQYCTIAHSITVTDIGQRTLGGEHPPRNYLL